MLRVIRPIEKTDQCVCFLLKHLSDTITNITEFENFVETLPLNQHMFVMEEDGEIIGVSSVFIERKIIHGFGKVAHIEDVVISPRHQARGLGKELVSYLVHFAKTEKCYKCILNCVSQKELFYKKCGFSPSQIQMSYYF